MGISEKDDSDEYINNIHLIEKYSKPYKGWSRNKKNENLDEEIVDETIDIELYGTYKGKIVKVYAAVKTSKGFMFLAKYEDGKYVNNKNLIHISKLESLDISKKKILCIKEKEVPQNDKKRKRKKRKNIEQEKRKDS